MWAISKDVYNSLRALFICEVMKKGLENPITMIFQLTANASELHLMTSTIKIIFCIHTDTHAHMYFCKLISWRIGCEGRLMHYNWTQLYVEFLDPDKDLFSKFSRSLLSAIFPKVRKQSSELKQSPILQAETNYMMKN